jgi:Putative auto-transporter adhesin, head GIN domain
MVVLLSGCGSHSTSSSGTSTGTGHTEGSGVVATEQRTVPDFTRVELAGTSTVRVRVGAPKRVVVRGDDNLLPLITTKVADNTLVIGQSGSFNSHRGIEVDVATPSLVGGVLSGAGDFQVTGVRADRFTVEVSGAGALQASGRATRNDVSLTGVGEARLTDLVTNISHVVVSGTGSATVFVRKSLDATVSGTGAVVYLGKPARVKKSVTGTGTIRPG